MRLKKIAHDITSLWRDDFTAFLIGCYFTFDAALLRAAIAEAGPPLAIIHSPGCMLITDVTEDDLLSGRFQA